MLLFVLGSTIWQRLASALVKIRPLTADDLPMASGEIRYPIGVPLRSPLYGFHRKPENGC